ncbi:MAG: DNA polymerase III subunit delta [Oscillospiraceae bacterium]|jgi:DNA polymerase-3 subunit delta
MAKKTAGKTEKTDYGALIRALRKNGPERLYLLWGEEDYLRESFFAELKKACLSDGGDEFNYHRLSGESFDLQALSQAIDAMPFLGGRSLIEVRDFDPNAVKDAKAEDGEKNEKKQQGKQDAAVLTDVLSDIPTYCTVVLLLPTGVSPDGRLGFVRTLKKLGNAIEFTTQPQSQLVGWIARRFAALGKTISRENCEKLIFTSGEHMTRLVPEIEKIAGGTAGEEVTARDIDRLAQHIPEADVFAMTDRLAEKNFDAAAALLAELLASRENHPIMLLALIGGQMRKLYVARVALDSNLGADFVMKACNLKMSFLAEKLLRAAKGFTTPQLAHAVELCAQCDYRMKSSGEDDEDILKELLLRIAAGEEA